VRAVLGLKGGEAQARYAARCGSAGRELLSNIMALQGIMFRQMLPPLPLPHNLPHTLSPLPLPHTPSPLPLPHTLPHTLQVRSETWPRIPSQCCYLSRSISQHCCSYLSSSGASTAARRHVDCAVKHLPIPNHT